MPRSTLASAGSACLICLFWPLAALAQPAGYSHARVIQIQGSQIAGSTPILNMPVLVSMTHMTLRTPMWGGVMQSSSAFDVVFTLATDCNTPLAYQRERYLATTGEYIAWVQVPVLTPGSDLTLYMFYGNSTVVADPSTNTIWDTNYMGVWHFNGTLNDASANGLNLINSSPASLVHNGSKIGQGRDLNNGFDVSSSVGGQHLRLPNNFLVGVSDFSFEGWVFLDRFSTYWERIFDFGASTTRNFFLCPTIATGTPSETRARITIGGAGNEQGPIAANSGTQTGAWVHWAVTHQANTQTMQVYRNGLLYGTATNVTRLPSDMEPSTANYFGRSQYAADHYIDAKFDEFRLSRSARTAAWILTNYRNQNDSSTFYSLSAPIPATDLCLVPLPVELLGFLAQPYGPDAVELFWVTATEQESDHFRIERSADGLDWGPQASVPAAGNSIAYLRYTHFDTDPLPGLSYYRLAMVDLDGSERFSEVRSVDRTHLGSGILLYPNPATDHVIIAGAGNATVEVYDQAGRLVLAGQASVPLRSMELPNGQYQVVVHGAGRTDRLPLVIRR